MSDRTPEQAIKDEARRDHIAWMMDNAKRVDVPGKGERFYIVVPGPIPAWIWPQGGSPRAPVYATIRKYDAPRPGGWAVKANCPKDYRPRWHVLVWGRTMEELEEHYGNYCELCENGGEVF